MEKRGVFCPRFWNGLQIYPDGLITICCLFDKYFGRIQEIENVSEHLTNNKELQEFRRKVLNGEEVEFCKYCYREEKLMGNKHSLRGYSIDIAGLDENKLTPETKHDIKFLDFRISNKCNLHCRMCWPYCSSTWEQILGEKTTKVDPKKVRELVLTIKNIQGLKELYFAGGEPFIIDEVWEILDQQIENRCTGVALRFNTNLTVLKYKDWDILKILEKWLQLGNRLELSVSYDGIGKVIEYCRTGCSWEVLDRNLRKVKEVLGQYEKVNIALCPTVSLLNILHLKDLIEYSHEVGVKCYIGNMLSRPRFYSLGAFPKSKKDLIIGTLEKQFGEYPSDELLQCLDFVSNEIGTNELKQVEVEPCREFYKKDPEFSLINPILENWYEL